MTLEVPSVLLHIASAAGCYVCVPRLSLRCRLGIGALSIRHTVRIKLESLEWTVHLPVDG